MAKRQMLSKENLLTDIDRSWAALFETLDRLTEAQMTTIKDSEGWTVKDHIVHLAAWERSILFFLQGRPRYEGLDVSKALYVADIDDQINAVIQQQHRNLSLAQARAQLQEVHKELLAVLRRLEDADLQRPYRDFLPADPGDGDDRLAVDVIAANTAGHFKEHLAWIVDLVDTES